MDKNKLTLLACSGSLITTMLLSDPSNAMPLQNSGDRTQRLDRLTIPQPTQTEQIISPADYEKRLKQAAFTRFGCNCANCVSAIRQLVQTGEIFL